MLHQLLCFIWSDMVFYHGFYFLVRHMSVLNCDISLKVSFALRNEQLYVGIWANEQIYVGNSHFLSTNRVSVLHCAFTVLNKILTSVPFSWVIFSREILFLNLRTLFFTKWQAFLMALHFNQGTEGYFNLTTAVFSQMAALSYIVCISHQKAQLDKSALGTTPHIDMEVIWFEIGF